MYDPDQSRAFMAAPPESPQTPAFPPWDGPGAQRRPLSTPPHSRVESEVQSVPALPTEPPQPMLREVLTALRRRTMILVIVVVALPALALGYSITAEKQYTATAKLLFRDPGFDSKVLGGGSLLSPSLDPAREAATNIGLVSLDTVALRASHSKAIRARGLTADEIRTKILVAAQGQSNVVTIGATDTDPVFAAALANTVGKKYIAFRRDADRKKIGEAVLIMSRQLNSLTPEQRKAARGIDLRAQLDQLRVLAALQTGNAELVQSAAAPSSPSSPKPLRNTLLALFFAIALGVGLALLRDRLDHRLRDRDDAEKLLGRPVLGVIPESGALKGDGGDALHLAGQEAEAFRTLRANLRYYDIDRDIRSLLVTSSAPGDGKSTVARCLAATAAAAGVRAVLVEADLRRPTLNGLYPVLRQLGLSEALTDQAPLAAVIQQLPVSIAGAPTGRSLDVIGAGTPPPNPTDLLESDRMRAVLDELHARYELVIIDSSPITVVPDSIPLLRQISGVLVVMRESKSTNVGARKLRDQLAHLGVLPLGLVMNGTAPVEDKAAYGYYAYAPAPGAAAPAAPAASNGASHNGSSLRIPRLPSLGRRKTPDRDAKH
jgi:succinoglycan biosynthesis transport protein ExoP